MAYTNEVYERRPATIARSARSVPLLHQIVEVLLEMGGSAHRDAVIDQIARRQGAIRASASLTQQIVCAFERHCARATNRKETALVYLPFGEGSRRWGLVSRPLVTPAPHGVVIDRAIEGFLDGGDSALAPSSAMGGVSPPPLYVALREAMAGSHKANA
jgi:hypothetical protein